MCMTWLIYIYNVYVTWLMHTGEKSMKESLRFFNVTHSYVWYDSIMWMMWFIYIHGTHVTRHDSCVPARIQRRDPLDSIMRLVHICHTTHSCVLYDSFVHMAYMWHDSGIRARNQRRDPWDSMTWHIYMCDVTHSSVWCDHLHQRHTSVMTHAYRQRTGGVIYEKSIMWHIHMWDIIFLYVCHDSSIHVTYVWHDSSICARNHWRNPWYSIM